MSVHSVKKTYLLFTIYYLRFTIYFIILQFWLFFRPHPSYNLAILTFCFFLQIRSIVDVSPFRQKDIFTIYDLLFTIYYLFYNFTILVIFLTSFLLQFGNLDIHLLFIF